MGKSSPATIDYQAAAVQEAEAAKEITTQQTYANRPSRQNPWGAETWDTTSTIDPSTGKPVTQWQQNTNLAEPLNQALWDQMLMQQKRSALASGMMGGLQNQYFDEQGNYVAPDWSSAPGMFSPTAPQQLSLQDMPDLWGQLQWDIPQYQTTGQVRQLNYGALPDVDAPQWTQQRAEQAYYDRLNQRLQPQFESEAQALEIKMRNQGLAPGDEAWQAQIQSLNNRKTDAYQSALNESLMAGGSEAERMFGMQTGRRGMFAGELQDLGNFANQAANSDFQQRMAAGSQGFQDTLSAAQFQNQARGQSLQERMGAMGYNQQQAYQYADYQNQLRQQQLNEYLAQRGFTLNEIQALLNNQQVSAPQFNEFTGATKSDTPQYMQAAMLTGQQNAASASAENAYLNNLLGGATSIAGMAGMFSDRRLKSNIRKLGERNGVNWYRYTIFGEQQIGVMADEVPWAATEHPSGFLVVDYSKL